MTGHGVPKPEHIDGSGLRVGVVAASWYAELTDGLVAGARRAIADAAAQPPQVVRVPGSFELPVGAQAMARAGCDAVVALGVIIRGCTPHFQYVCQAATDGLGRIAIDTGVPIGFGLLMCDDEAQARDRAGLPGSSQDKGREAAEAAMLTALALRRLS